VSLRSLPSTALVCVTNKNYKYSIIPVCNHNGNEFVMGAPVSIVLQRSERKKYEQLCRSGKTPVRLKERLTIVLLADDGLNNGEIAQELSISAHMAGRWRNRFAEDGLSGIEKNLPRGHNHGGKNTRAQARLRQKIIAKTTTEKPPNATHWSTRTLAKVVGTSHNFVAKVWRECGFKPHLISQFKISNDPHFAEKLEDVVGLYLGRDRNADCPAPLAQIPACATNALGSCLRFWRQSV